MNAERALLVLYRGGHHPGSDDSAAEEDRRVHTGGKAAYPSTVLMNVITRAGCRSERDSPLRSDA